MNRRVKSALIATTAIMLFGSAAKADDRKELKTEKGKPVVLGNLLSTPSDCNSNPGPVPVPILREKPSHGLVLMQIVVSDVAESGSCPARKIPSIALYYKANADFVGVDSVQVQLDVGDKSATEIYRITVQEIDGK